MGPGSEGYARHSVMIVSDQASLRRVDKLNWLFSAILKAVELFELLLLGPLNFWKGRQRRRSISLAHVRHQEIALI